jgi:hypothetical protein
VRGSVAHEGVREGAEELSWWRSVFGEQERAYVPRGNVPQA